MEKTLAQYSQVQKECKDVFVKKLKDYGVAWRILRPESLTDQIYIKANRIRSLQILGEAKVDEDEKTEFIGIINYAIIALIQLKLGYADTVDISVEKAIEMYDYFFEKSKELMTRKNHDYGEAWRLMRISSFTDLILMKIFRTKQIEDNQGKTIISEGVDANYFDMINYSVFALIKIGENNEKKK
jgi:hypothetical protein